MNYLGTEILAAEFGNMWIGVIVAFVVIVLGTIMFLA